MAMPAAHTMQQTPTDPGPNHPFRFSVIVNAGPDGAVWTELARRVEGLGFRALLLPDNPQAAPALMPTLAWVASQTTTLHVGTYVAVNDLRHPLQLARDAATLQLLSGGRFELGLGVGRPGAERDYAELGITMGAPGGRIDALDATIDVLERLFADERVTGPVGRYTMHDAALGPALAGAPRPHLLVAASGPRMLRLAGRRADTVALGIQPETPATEVSRLAGIVREAAAGRGTPPALNINLAGVGDRLVSYLRPRLADRVEALAAQDVPGLLMGDVDTMVESLHRRRSMLGITSYTVGADLVDAIAPVIARLA